MNIWHKHKKEGKKHGGTMDGAYCRRRPPCPARAAAIALTTAPRGWTSLPVGPVQ